MNRINVRFYLKPSSTLLVIVLLGSISLMLYDSFQRTKRAPTTFLQSQVEYFYGDSSQDLDEVMVSESWQSDQAMRPRPLERLARNWVRVRLQNNAPFTMPVVILVDNPSLDYLDFFVVDDREEVINRRFLGVRRNLSNASDYSLPRIEYRLNSKEAITVYVYAESQQAHALPLFIYDEDQYREYKESVMMLWGGFIGLVVMMSLYYISLYRAMGESVYLGYAFFTIVTLLYLAQLYGFGFHVMPLAVQQALTRSAGSVALLLMLTILVFSRNYVALEQRESSGTASRVYPWLLSGLVALSVVFPARYVINLSLLLQPVLFGYLVGLTWVVTRQRLVWAQLYLLSWLPVFIGLPISTLAAMNWIESTLMTRYALLFAIFIQFALTAVSFSRRMKLSEERRIYQAMHDRYTNLPNRSALIQTLNRWSSSHLQYSLVFIDVCNFLRFLPYVGAERASQLIAEVSCITRQYWQDHPEYFTKLGTVSFDPPYLVRDHLLAIVVRHDAAEAVMTGLHGVCDRDVVVADIEISINPVIGAVNYPDDSDDPEELIQKGMQAVDFAKREGLPYAFYVGERMQYSEMEVRIATDLPKAILDNELELYHQPQMVLKDFSVYGSEVLLRWQHPALGFIPPDLFVRVAEDIGMMTDLTQWVIERALQQQKQLQQAGFQHQLSINISGKDVGNRHLFQRVSELLDKFGIDGHRVTLELTESVAVRDSEALRQLMARFQSLGVHFSLDDFGTGYSSLEALSKLDFNELKIDRSFVQNMLESERDYTISSATIDLANRLNLHTVAEGVENEQVIAMLISCDCRIAQGYYFSKPKPFQEYLNWLQKAIW